MRRIARLGVGGALAIALAFCACEAEPGDIVIGGVFFDDIDDSARLRLLAVELAIDEINESGVFGRKLKLVNLSPSVGDTYDTELAAANVEELYNEHNAVGVVSLYSDIAAEIITLTNKPAYMDLVQCSCSASNPNLNIPTSDIGDMNDTFYRTVVTDAFQGELMLKLITEEYNWHEVGIFHADNTFGNGLRDVITDLMNDVSEYDIVLEVSVPEGDLKKNPLLEDIDEVIAAAPDVLVLAINEKSWVPEIVGLLVEHGYEGDFLLSDGAKADELFAECNHAESWPDPLAPWLADGHVIIGTEPLTTGGANSEEFENKYRSEYGEPPNTYSYTAYDCVYAFAFALLYAGSDHYTDYGVKAHLPKFKERKREDYELEVGIGDWELKKAADEIRSGGRIDFEGASGRLIFDGNGDRPTGGTQTFVPNADVNGWKAKDVYDENYQKLSEDD